MAAVMSQAVEGMRVSYFMCWGARVRTKTKAAQRMAWVQSSQGLRPARRRRKR